MDFILKCNNNIMVAYNISNIIKSIINVFKFFNTLVDT